MEYIWIVRDRALQGAVESRASRVPLPDSSMVKLERAPGDAGKQYSWWFKPTETDLLLHLLETHPGKLEVHKAYHVPDDGAYSPG